jgi:uncharacterized protein
MKVFVDTSALYALLDEGDSNHAAAAEAFAGLRGAELVTHAYVLVETLALVSRRLGWDAVIRLLVGLLGVVTVQPIDAATHLAALRAYRESASPAVSYVDRASFAFMHAARIAAAFAFDADFARAGFEVLPA